MAYPCAHQNRYASTPIPAAALIKISNGVPVTMNNIFEDSVVRAFAGKSVSENAVNKMKYEVTRTISGKRWKFHSSGALIPK